MMKGKRLPHSERRFSLFYSRWYQECKECPNSHSWKFAKAIMLLNPDMLPQQDGAMSIEPQYDGVIMLSPEAVLFSDAKPRPDGRKVYHVFERTPGDGPRDEAAQNDDFRSRREQLFSQAHENTIHNIQQVTRKHVMYAFRWNRLKASF